MPQPVIDAITGHIALESQIGGYEAAAVAAPAIADSYAAIAELIGARPHNIAVRASAPLRSTFITKASSLLRDDPPLACASVLSPFVVFNFFAIFFILNQV